jgi:hypothetical protein
MRAVPVAVEVLDDLLHGRIRPSEPIDLPKDTEVVGSMKQHPYATRHGCVVLLCQSSEWDRKEDIDRELGDIRVFEPKYRAKGATP